MSRVKLEAIDRWIPAVSGEAIPLPGKKRTVTIEFNVDEYTVLSVLQDKKSTLLRAVQPWECPLEVSFVVLGDCAVIPETEGQVFWKSDDGDILAYPVLTESFTKLEQRMEMTAEMEVTILRANLRAEQRKREVAELLLLKKQREDAAAANADPETGEVDAEPEIVVDADEGAAEPSEVPGNSSAPKP